MAKTITIGAGNKMDKLTLSNVMRHMILNPDSKTTFYAKLLQKMSRVETEAVVLAAVGVEKTGITLYYNPVNVGKLSYEQLVYTLCHEIMHVVFKHQQRSGGTVTERDNIAADLAVNSLLGKIDMPLLFPGEGAFKDLPGGKSYEWYYMNLPKNTGTGGKCPYRKGKPTPGDSKKTGKDGNGSKGGKGAGTGKSPGSGKGEGQGQGQGSGADDGQCSCDGSGGCGRGRGNCGGYPEGGHDGHSGHKIRQGKPQDTCADAHWDKAVREAYQEAKRIGNLPGELQSAIEDMLKPRINWRVRLRKFTGHFTQMGTKPSCKRMNRRVPLFGIVPGQVSKYVAKMLYAIDTSGSMGQKEVNAAVREMKALPVPYTMVECDTRIANVTVMSRWKRFSGSIRGGGGTDFRPVFQYAKKHNFNGIIFVTDLCGDFPTDNKIKTLWLSTVKGQVAPFGETVDLDLD